MMSVSQVLSELIIHGFYLLETHFEIILHHRWFHTTRIFLITSRQQS